MKQARYPHPLAISTALRIVLRIALSGVVVFVFGAHALGCGGQSPQKQPSTPSSSMDSEAFGEESGDGGDDGESSKSRITRLFNEIGNAREQLDLPREPGGDDIEDVQGTPMPQSEDLQPAAPPKSQTCKDICRISEKICDNAALICELADELGGDPWAVDKCDSGKASCNEASKRCKTCVDTE